MSGYFVDEDIALDHSRTACRVVMGNGYEVFRHLFHLARAARL
jgi:hypothetical protein